MRVSNGVIFEICGVLIKFLLKKWTFVAKKWRFIQICPKWRSNQEWRSICADTVDFIKIFKIKNSSFTQVAKSRPRHDLGRNKATNDYCRVIQSSTS